MDNIGYESAIWGMGVKYIAGVDEVGRGCLAGPIVAAAVILPPDITTFDRLSSNYKPLSQIKDSKKLTEKRRIELNKFIREIAIEWSIAEISNDDIDSYGMSHCNKKVLRDAVLKLERVEHALIDHFNIDSYETVDRNIKTTSITNGDDLSLTIAAASIIAKVYRDGLMKQKYHLIYPVYGFDTHVGYGTKKHIEAIKTHGYCPIHRKSFAVNTFKFER